MRTCFRCLLTVALALFVCLAAAGTAQAFAIYNHTDHHICITKWYTYVHNCHISVDPHSTYNGKHGSGISGIGAGWETKEHMYATDEFNIPKGGYARVYDTRVKVYKHDGKHVKTMSIKKQY